MVLIWTGELSNRSGPSFHISFITRCDLLPADSVTVASVVTSAAVAVLTEALQRDLTLFHVIVNHQSVSVVIIRYKRRHLHANKYHLSLSDPRDRIML